MVRQVTYSYEQSSESGRERHLPIPYARQEDVTPTKGDPAAVLGTATFPQICGTIISLDAVDSIATLNVAKGAVYLHNVRTVATYAGNVENAWADINIGSRVYYDRSATMPAFTKLSLSPLDRLGGTNTLFGHVVMLQGETAASFPKLAGVAGNTHECAVQQA